MGLQMDILSFFSFFTPQNFWSKDILCGHQGEWGGSCAADVLLFTLPLV